MAVGRILYILGMVFAVYSSAVFIFSFFSGGGNIIMVFGILNGVMAMGVGDLVIDSHHRKRQMNQADTDEKEAAV
ncbi:hypothetical protein [Sediminibacillus albus]|uniref:Uncharacterized protein n=1 Tax=Sediminibacillus albus TaxID=407036 RepID=A0A1G8VGP2_9BACI|nr:hypothetical protein [Sediminibacillus albus]SDJ65193.1 hypothetical protein SAMN05216243_0096 [Sediminibacillus albus]